MKGKVGDVKKKQSAPATNNTGTKSSAPAVKKNLNIETDNMLNDDKDKSNTDKKEAQQPEDQDDDFGRDESEKPITKEDLEE